MQCVPMNMPTCMPPRPRSSCLSSGLDPVPCPAPQEVLSSGLYPVPCPAPQEVLSSGLDAAMAAHAAALPWPAGVAAIVRLEMMAHTYMHACIHTCRHTYIHTYVHACMRACVHTCMRTCIRACIYAYMQVRLALIARGASKAAAIAQTLECYQKMLLATQARLQIALAPGPGPWP